MSKSAIEDVRRRAAESASKARTQRRTKPFRELMVAGAVVVTATVLSQVSPYFLTASNLGAVAVGMVPEAIVAVGMMYLLIAGGFDLSVGSVMALSGVVVAWLLLQGAGPVIAAAAGIAVGAVAGLANGFMVTFARVNALIATLAMMWIARGVALAATQGYPLANLPKSFATLGQGYVLDLVPASVVLMLVLVVVADVLGRKSLVARQAYYVGGNERAARLSGIRVERVRLAFYLLSGTLAGLAGVVLTSRLMSATPTAGVGVELRAVSAAVIGGASLAGGEGTILGAFLGIVFMSLIQNGLTLLDVSLYWHGVVTGVILAAAVTVDMLSRPKRS